MLRYVFLSGYFGFLSYILLFSRSETHYQFYCFVSTNKGMIQAG